MNHLRSLNHKPYDIIVATASPSGMKFLQNNGFKLHVIFNFLDFDFLLCITGICMMGTLDKLIGSIIKLFVITNKFSENLTSETQVHLDFQAVSFCP